MLTEEISKIDLNSNDDKRMQSTDLIERYVYGTSKGLVNENEETKSNNTIKQYKK